MNKKYFKKNYGKTVRLRPPAVGFREKDDLWRIESPGTEGDIRLRNIRTSHVIELGTDHVAEYRSDPNGDGFLILRSELHLREGVLSLEPIGRGMADTAKSEAQTERRRRVREALVLFHKLIHDTDHGSWPGTSFDDWAPLQRKVLELRERVKQLLDIDRPTAGLAWCDSVRDCVDKGWELLHNHFGQATLMGPRVGVLHEQLPARRQAFYDAYQRVIEG